LHHRRVGGPTPPRRRRSARAWQRDRRTHGSDRPNPMTPVPSPRAPAPHSGLSFGPIRHLGSDRALVTKRGALPRIARPHRLGRRDVARCHSQGQRPGLTLDRDGVHARLTLGRVRGSGPRNHPRPRCDANACVPTTSWQLAGHGSRVSLCKLLIILTPELGTLDALVDPMAQPRPELGSSVSAPDLCTYCGLAIAAEESIAIVGPITLHFGCWITRLHEWQARDNTRGRLAASCETQLATASANASN
jgi:hypothetical protein